MQITDGDSSLDEDPPVTDGWPPLKHLLTLWYWAPRLLQALSTLLNHISSFKGRRASYHNASSTRFQSPSLS